MLGFAVAAYFELVQGKDVFQQVKAYPLLTVATFVIFSVASWIPLLQGQSYNVKSGPFTPKVGRKEGCWVANVTIGLAAPKMYACAASWLAGNRSPMHSGYPRQCVTALVCRSNVCVAQLFM
jgi:hypothetical protein